ncbi:PAS domain-containing sensor histidine kinase [Mucilaginibacter sp. NFX135]|uniref:PAS domain-containing sensor histidine kinase n=1 Tax=Mucilaginibacter sp. NFX135 TaxID=3402687 RepID=UPI003AFAC0D0
MKDEVSFSNLRNQAEKVLQKVGDGATALNETDMQVLFQELQVHQIELEMQNDELNLANEELERHQARFADIYDLAPLGYFILTHACVIEEVNYAGTVLLEAGRFSLIGKPFNIFISADQQEIFRNFYKAMQSGERQRCQLKMITKTASPFYAQLEGILTKRYAEHSQQYYIAVIDITERIKTEKDLAEVKERLELSLEASSAGTWELDLETMKFYLDEFNYRICAIPGGKFDGQYQTFINLIHPDDREMADQQFRNSINQEKEIDLVCRMINSKGETCYAAIRGHVIDEPGPQKRLVGIMMDITEKKRLEDAASKLEQNQQRAITLATLAAGESERRRISDALHDSVSQLLYGIKIKLGMLDQSAAMKPIHEINELLAMAIRETRNISFELAPSILIDFGLPATIDELAKRLSGKNMVIKAKASGFNERMDLLLETSIFRIIQELINNCMKHAEASLVKLEIKKGKDIYIEVRDNGKGFDVAEQERSPAGAGLSSIRNRLSLYNGQMKMLSEPGMGTAVMISLQYNTIQYNTIRR